MVVSENFHICVQTAQLTGERGHPQITAINWLAAQRSRAVADVEVAALVRQPLARCEPLALTLRRDIGLLSQVYRTMNGNNRATGSR